MGIRRELEADFDFEIIDEFLDHSAMMIEVMEGLIVDLGSEQRYTRSLDELFRIFHNLKSAAGFLQMEPMVRLATLVEDALEQLRSYPGPANDDVVNWLLAINDIFLRWQDDLKLDNELTKIQFSLLRLPDMETV